MRDHDGRVECPANFAGHMTINPGLKSPGLQTAVKQCSTAPTEFNADLETVLKSIKTNKNDFFPRELKKKTTTTTRMATQPSETQSNQKKVVDLDRN